MLSQSWFWWVWSVSDSHPPEFLVLICPFESVKKKKMKKQFRSVQETKVSPFRALVEKYVGGLREETFTPGFEQYAQDVENIMSDLVQDFKHEFLDSFAAQVHEFENTFSGIVGYELFGFIDVLSMIDSGVIPHKIKEQVLKLDRRALLTAALDVKEKYPNELEALEADEIDYGTLVDMGLKKIADDFDTVYRSWFNDATAVPKISVEYINFKDPQFRVMANFESDDIEFTFSKMYEKDVPVSAGMGALKQEVHKALAWLAS